LGLARHPEVVAAAQEALQLYGVGARASALVSGRTAEQVALEEELADFEQTEAALLFPSGFAANLGTLLALCGPEDAIFCDRLNHASLVDGCRYSKARLRVYRHDQLDRLERELAKNEPCRRRFLVTDTVFSMDGDLAPLLELCELADRHEVILIVDEAHGTGVFGSNGRGVCEHFGVSHRIPVKIGTLSKALGCLGGFVAGSHDLIETLRHQARSQVYSTALPPAVCAAARASLRLIRSEQELPNQIRSLSAAFREALDQQSLTPRTGSVGPIVPLELGSAEAAVAAARQLEELGWLVGAIRPPTVPNGTSRLRISLSLGLPRASYRELAHALGDCLRNFQQVA